MSTPCQISKALLWKNKKKTHTFLPTQNNESEKQVFANHSDIKFTMKR